MRFNVDKCKVMHLGRGNFGGNYVKNGGFLGLCLGVPKDHERFESLCTLCLCVLQGK